MGRKEKEGISFSPSFVHVHAQGSEGERWERGREEEEGISSSPLRAHMNRMEKGRAGAGREGGSDGEGNVDAVEGGRREQGEEARM